MFQYRLLRTDLLYVGKGLILCFNNPFPHTDAFWSLYSRRLLKTVWQKEKLPLMSNFSIWFSTLFTNITFIYRSFPHFSLVVFKVVCKYFVCGKGVQTYVLNAATTYNDRKHSITLFSIYIMLVLSNFRLVHNGVVLSRSLSR